MGSRKGSNYASPLQVRQVDISSGAVIEKKPEPMITDHGDSNHRREVTHRFQCYGSGSTGRIGFRTGLTTFAVQTSLAAFWSISEMLPAALRSSRDMPRTSSRYAQPRHGIGFEKAWIPSTSIREWFGTNGPHRNRLDDQSL
jgi:hypothetical protein